MVRNTGCLIFDEISLSGTVGFESVVATNWPLLGLAQSRPQNIPMITSELITIIIARASHKQGHTSLVKYSL